MIYEVWGNDKTTYRKFTKRFRACVYAHELIREMRPNEYVYIAAHDESSFTEKVFDEEELEDNETQDNGDNQDRSLHRVIRFPNHYTFRGIRSY